MSKRYAALLCFILFAQAALILFGVYFYYRNASVTLKNDRLMISDQIDSSIGGVKSLASDVSAIQTTLNKIKGDVSELRYANLFQDSIISSPWVKDKSFSLNFAAANYSFMYMLFQVLDNASPVNVLEFGLGQSTRLTTQYAKYKNPATRLDIIEHDQMWVDVYKQKYPVAKNIRIHDLPLEYFTYNDQKNDRYNGERLASIMGKTKYNLIIVDGPVGKSKNFPRSNVLDLIPQNLAADFMIIIDDHERLGEREMAAQLLKKLIEQGIPFSVFELTSFKNQLVVVSKSWAYFLTM